MRKLNKLILLFVIIVLVAMAFVACDIFKGSQDGNKDGVTFTITFDTQGGSEVKPLVLKEGETINLPNNPTKDGYIFDGWYLSDEFIEKFNATQTISSNITVYAKWKEDSGNQDEKQTYTITFDTQGGSEVKPLVLKEGETINLPSNPTKDGFLFASWYLDSSFVNKFVNNGKVSSNITLYAKWVADDCEHTPVIDAAVAPTCTKTGLTEGSHCSKCEAILIQQEEIAELGHIGGQATCTEKAICTRCHEEYGNLLVHDYGELIAQVDSTCSATGMQAHYECSKCHKVFKNDENKTETIVESLVIAKNPNAHNFGEWHDEVPSICSATGTKGYKTCLYCGKHYENDGVTEITDLVIPIDNNAHSFGGWVKDENADTHTRVCAHNGEHTQTEDCHGGEATCSEKATCEVCHARYGNLLSHNYQNGVCTTCGDRHASVGLEYSFNSDKSGYIVTGIGTCDDNDIIIPSEYNSKPVTSIGDSAFRGCTGLTSITIPDSVTSIGSCAFSNCTRLTSVTIGSGVTSIGESAFSGCTGLTSVTIPDSVVSIGRDAFSRCTGLKSITIPDSVTSIGKDAFRGCTGLTSVTIGSSVSSIGDNAFYECKNLIAVYNKSSLTITARSSDNGYVAYYAKNVYNGESGSILSTDDNGYVIYTDGAEKILVSYKGNETELTLPSDITQINQYAFYERTGLTSVTIPNSVTSIGDWAFFGCTGLTSITIPDSVTSIGNSAFSNCTRLTSVTIGSGVTSIGSSAFFACYKLIEVYNKSFLTIRARSFDNGYVAYYAKNIYTAEDGSKLSTDDNGYVIYTDGAEKILVSYKGTETELTLPSDITQINQYAFHYCTGLTSVVIPDSVTSIGNDAFYGCAGLKRIVIGKGITTLQSGLLRSCASLESITIPFVGASKIASNGYDRVLGYIFGYTMESSVSSTVSGATRQILWDNRYYWYYIPSSLKTVVINDSETIISRYAFQNCTGLTSVTIPNSVTSIGDVAFRGCTGLTSITIPESVTSIGLYAFSGCNGLTSIHYTGDIAGWCKISGLGDLMDSSRTLYIGGEEVKGELVIPDSVTSIGNSAFSGCSGLTSITIPDSVTSIDNAAFADCTGLTSIVIPDSVTSIGNGAFEGCTGLTSISGPSAMVSIVAKQISSKSFIAKITSGDSIGSYAFRDCTGLTSITIPDSVTSIGGWAFEGCTRLTSITIGNGVTSIGDEAFRYCDKLIEVYNKSSLTIAAGSSDNGYVAYYAKNVYTIEGGSKLLIDENGYVTYTEGSEKILVAYTGTETELTLPSDLTQIYKYAFYERTGLTSVTIPDSVTRIGEYAFYNCSGLTSVTIGSGVASIGEDAFYGCSGLTSVVIPDSVTSIGEDAFYGCSGLTSVTIGSGVTSIGTGAFYNCGGLTSIYYTGDVAGWCGISGLGNLMRYGSSSKMLYIGGNKVEGELIIPDSVTSIGEGAFYNCGGLTSVTIGNSVTSIGNSAFYGCTGLTSIYYTGDIAGWCGISGLGNLTSSSRTIYIGGNKVEGQLTIPNSVTSIGEDAFYGCSGLTSITIPNGVTSIGSSAFRGCSGLTSIVIPDSVTNIGSSAFYNCTGLTSITIGSGVTRIGNYAFYGCYRLIEVYNKSSVSITAGSSDNGNVAYYAKNVYTSEGGSNLTTDENGYVVYTDGTDKILVEYMGTETELTLPSDITQIYKYAFYERTGLTSVTILDRVTRIGEYAFYNCSGLTSVTIPDSVTSIGSHAFSGCTGLTSVTIGNSVTSIGNSAFYNCTGLTSINYSGTKAQWKSFAKESNWKYNVPTSCKIICLDGTLSI